MEKNLFNFSKNKKFNSLNILAFSKKFYKRKNNKKFFQKWGKEDWQTKDQYEKGKKAATAAKKHKEKKS